MEGNAVDNKHGRERKISIIIQQIDKTGTVYNRARVSLFHSIYAGIPCEYWIIIDVA